MRLITCSVLAAAAAFAQIPGAVRAPKAYPPAVKPETVTDLTVSVFVPDARREAVLLLQARTGSHWQMLDDGAGPDAVGGDLTFTARASVSSRGMAAGQCEEFRTWVGERLSDPLRICATGLPVGPAPRRLSRRVGRYFADELLVSYEPGLSEREMAMIAARAGAAIAGSLPQLGLVQWRFAAAAGSEEELRRRGAVAGVRRAIAVPAVELAAVTPNDPYFQFNQGNLRSVRANQAWVSARGGPLVAVIDSGIDTDHPEFEGRIQAGGIDYSTGQNLPEDDHGHGSHVAGIIAARANNFEGVAGIAWRSKVLVERVFKMVLQEKDPVGSMADVVDAIAHATAQGARVINLSLGQTGQDAADLVCPAVQQAVEAGAVVVAGAGNNGNKGMFYPAACDAAVAVAAVDNNDVPASFTNRGDWVDIAAPGVAVASPVIKGSGNGLIDCPLCSPSGYGFVSGTSMASPHVAAAAALVLGRFPWWEPAKVRERLEESARKVNSTVDIGAGVLDVFGAAFDASFEDGAQENWEKSGNASSFPTASAIHGSRAVVLATQGAPGGSTRLLQRFVVEPGVGQMTARVRFAVSTGTQVTGDGHVFDIRVRTAGGGEHVLASGKVVAIATQQFGDTKTSGWKTVQVTFLAPPGPAELRFEVSDGGDRAGDSLLFADHIEFLEPFGITL